MNKNTEITHINNNINQNQLTFMLQYKPLCTLLTEVITYLLDNWNKIIAEWSHLGENFIYDLLLRFFFNVILFLNWLKLEIRKCYINWQKIKNIANHLVIAQ